MARLRTRNVIVIGTADGCWWAVGLCREEGWRLAEDMVGVLASADSARNLRFSPSRSAGFAGVALPESLRLRAQTRRVSFWHSLLSVTSLILLEASDEGLRVPRTMVSFAVDEKGRSARQVQFVDVFGVVLNAPFDLR